jgi:DNA mismatch repair protein MutS
MDEIGRGTSTYDGLSLAWACAEHLALNVKALTLFATHYFELTTLADELAGCVNVHLDAVEHNDNLVFLHKVKPGTVNRSYGLQVATLAGVPRQVVNRAKDKLLQLEQEQHNQVIHPQTTSSLAAKEESELEKIFADLQPDELSPREALDLIYQLKKLL